MHVRTERLLFVGLVLLVVVTVATILVSTSRTTDRAAVEQLTQVMERVALEAADEATVFLDPAERLARLTASFLADGLLDEQDEARLERYLLTQLQDNRDVAGAFVGRPDGDFYYVSRNQDIEGAVYRTKIIAVDGAARQVSLRYLDAAGEVVLLDSDPDDTYDPRSRPWYQAAVGVTGTVWTEPYIFFTSQQPGVTVAHAVRDSAGAAVGVVGVDTELRKLSDILTRLGISERGGAFVVDGGGRLVALRGAEVSGLDDANELVRLGPGDLESDAARAAWGVLVETGGPLLDETELGRFELDDEPWRTLAEPFADGRWDWTIAVYAPEEDFLGGLRTTQSANLRFAIGVGVLATLVALGIGLGLRHPVRRLQRTANTDALTGLPNRRALTEAGRRMFEAATLDERPIVVGLIDIDRFKAVNDNYGHGVGDEVLAAVATRMRRSLPATDVLARYGGEEFAILMPDTELSHGTDAAQRLRKAVNGAPINTSKGPVPVTVSVGLAPAGPATGHALRDVLQVADRALYQAKSGGRDQVVTAPGIEPHTV